MDIDPDGDVVLLIVEEAVDDDAWERRDSRSQAQQAGLLSWLARLDAFLAPGSDGRET